MIKPKTKKQKDLDKKNVEKTANNCAKVLKTFICELFDGEFRIDWIYLGTINKMQEMHTKHESAVTTQKEEYTFTSYEEDSKHEQWQNSTHIDSYK